MVEDQVSASDRIDAALARIERAVAARRAAHLSLARQHQALRTSMAEAIDAIDHLLAEPRG
ncbi:MAG: hypothetical protein C0476_07395 [Sphingomonas sp.]|nr:hypothetical protein [Sphingomonas sp.]